MTVLRDELANYLDRHGISARALSLQAGLSEKVVINLLSGSTVRPTGQTLDALGAAMGLDLTSMTTTPPANPTLEDIIGYLDAHVPESCSRDYRDQIVATLRRLPRWEGKAEPAEIPADKASLERFVARHNAAELGINSQSFDIYVSHINRALDFYYKRAAKLMINDVVGPYRDLYDVLAEGFDHRSGRGLRVGPDRRYKCDQLYEAGRIFAFLHAAGRPMSEVNGDDFAAFAKHLSATGSVRSATEKKAEKAAKRCLKTWRDLATDPDPAIRAVFTGSQVQSPFPNGVDKFGVGDDVAAPILADFDARITRWAKGELSRTGQTREEFFVEFDRSAPQHNASRRPAGMRDRLKRATDRRAVENDGGFLGRAKDRWKESTIKRRRGYVVSMTKALYATTGIRMTCIEDLLDLDNIDQAMQALERANPGFEDSAYLETIAKMLRTLARRWQRADDEHMAVLDDILADYERKQHGVTEGNKAKVRQFTKERLSAFFALPYRLAERVERLVRKRRRALATQGNHEPTDTELITDPMARLLEVAVALLILQLRPLRRANLLGLDVDRHFRMIAPDRLEIVIPRGDVVKGGESVRIVFDADDTGLVLSFRDRFRPILQAANRENNRLLFGARTNANGAVGLPDRIVATVRKELGVTLHLHLVRHLVGWVWLQRDPRALPQVAKLLGHRDLETTTRYYAEIDADLAQTDWVAIIKDYRDDRN